MPGIHVFFCGQDVDGRASPGMTFGETKEIGVTYAELVKRLKKHGLKQTDAGITMKLKRGTFSATFFGCLAAVELEGVVVLEEL
jgi:hypothetical protein